ncbi:MAG: hypothetical protein ACD_51C00249G0002 [uncultured bacterium]|nr:MAG: hypothetical protein ACD_51C00249G0002 [uncultured bacterium]OGJ47605.1 MAG: hypothetical protein A2244_00890 [Candidatus Peregrinibacteria bacterium RIFOXYA2_FULL_41_18]OGJ49594.1 MAG: hypothetical protein A2344_02220 [Candidatus Peregrinibacteria bacterium RIFOXYB12_FULL_41_12]OGJ53044.1 MAG: hypothetical protein A2448_01215 [Candidatus Peregrinibacteria bacterium RIFOXYC2_FULL_41_22]
MDSINPQDTKSELQKAIDQIKQWQKEGKNEDAMQGCKEILEIDPANTEVKSIMETLQKPAMATVPAPTPTPAVPTPVATPVITTPTPATPATTASTPATIPTPIVLPKPETKPVAEEKSSFDITAPENPLYSALNKSSPTKTEEKKNTTIKKETSHGIIINLIIIVVTISLLGGGAYAYLKFFGQSDVAKIDLPKEDTVVTTTDDNNTQEDEITDTEEPTVEVTEASLRNEQRFSDLTDMEDIVKNYYDVNGKYPDAIEFASFVSSYDPLDGQVDEAGQVFAYSYAVYDTDLGDNQEYILAALFEDKLEGNTIWTTGSDPQIHPDYRDSTAENFVMITVQTETAPIVDEPATEETTTKVKVKK